MAKSNYKMLPAKLEVSSRCKGKVDSESSAQDHIALLYNWFQSVIADCEKDIARNPAGEDVIMPIIIQHKELACIAADLSIALDDGYIDEAIFEETSTLSEEIESCKLRTEVLLQRRAELTGKS
jgi:hypothetical protein